MSLTAEIAKIATIDLFKKRPFAGSNTTGAVAEALRRKWVSIEANRDYIRGSRGRFAKKLRRSQ